MYHVQLYEVFDNSSVLFLGPGRCSFFILFAEVDFSYDLSLDLNRGCNSRGQGHLLHRVCFRA